jgi:hypothetical protein
LPSFEVPKEFIRRTTQKEPYSRPSVFISYSRVDTPALQRLQVHLKPLEKKGDIELWGDITIKAGDKWKQRIEEALDRAAIAVLLIGADFLASGFIYDNELPPLPRAAEEKGTRILPVVLKPCRFARDEKENQHQGIFIAQDQVELSVTGPVVAREENVASWRQVAQSELFAPRAGELVAQYLTPA